MGLLRHACPHGAPFVAGLVPRGGRVALVSLLGPGVPGPAREDLEFGCTSWVKATALVLGPTVVHPRPQAEPTLDVVGRHASVPLPSGECVEGGKAGSPAVGAAIPTPARQCFECGDPPWIKNATTAFGTLVDHPRP